MKIEFDAAKSEKNARELGLPFELVARFEWEGATFEEDERFSYAEARFTAAGFIGARLHIVCFTPWRDTRDQFSESQFQRDTRL